MTKPSQQYTKSHKSNLFSNELNQIIADIYCFDKLEDRLCIENETVKGVVQKYIDQILKEIQTRGISDTTELYMKLYKIATNLSLNKSFEPLQFRQSDKAGIPKLLKHLVPLLKSPKPKEKSLALTIAGLVKVIHLFPVFDPQPITEIGPKLENEFISKWKETCNVFCKSFKLKPVHKYEVRHLSGMKAGPNGSPAALYCYNDFNSYSQDLYSTLKDYIGQMSGSSQDLFTQTFEYLETTEKLPAINSRLALISEGGGKTRTVAICDYWSQMALKPLHDEIMKLLKTFVTDGTYCQGEQFERIKLLTPEKNFTWSYDLSKATDRFPIELQTILLERLFGENFSLRWKELMVNRDFQTPAGDSTVRYNTGQPLGMYSSWPVFALAHHCFILHCHRECNPRATSFTDYSILGDDVVLWSDKDNVLIGQTYYRLMNVIGVKINLDKSVLGDISEPRVEFAKRLLFQGKEISPVPARMLLAYVNDKSFIRQMLTDLQRRGLYLNGRLIPGYDSSNFKNRNQIVLIADYASRSHVAPHYEGNLWDDYTEQEIQSCISYYRVRVQVERLSKLEKFLINGETSVHEMFTRLQESEGRGARQRSTPITGCLESFLCCHPLPFIINDRIESVITLIDYLKKVAILGEDGYTELYGMLPEHISILEHTPDPLLDGWISTRQKRQDRNHAKILTRSLRKLQHLRKLAQS